MKDFVAVLPGFVGLSNRNRGTNKTEDCSDNRYDVHVLNHPWIIDYLESRSAEVAIEVA